MAAPSSAGQSEGITQHERKRRVYSWNRVMEKGIIKWRSSSIGPEPPCVRCLNTYKFAKEAAQQFAGETIEVRKISSRSDEAGNYGRVEGGRDIAEREQVKTDGDKFQRLMAEVGEA